MSCSYSVIKRTCNANSFTSTIMPILGRRCQISRKRLIPKISIDFHITSWSGTLPLCSKESSNQQCRSRDGNLSTSLAQFQKQTALSVTRSICNNRTRTTSENRICVDRNKSFGDCSQTLHAIYKSIHPLLRSLFFKFSFQAILLLSSFSHSHTIVNTQCSYLSLSSQSRIWQRETEIQPMQTNQFETNSWKAEKTNRPTTWASTFKEHKPTLATCNALEQSRFALANEATPIQERNRNSPQMLFWKEMKRSFEGCAVHIPIITMAWMQ